MKFVRINHRRWVFLAALAGLAVYASKTQMDADTERLRQIEANAVNEAMVSALGVDPWRGTSIGTMTRQLAAAAKSQAEEQMTLMTAHSDTADSDDQLDAGDEDVTDGYEIVFVDDDGAYVDEENDFETDHIDVTAIECDNQSVLIGLSWTASMEIEKWDVYLIGSLDLDGPAIFENKINPVAGTTNQIVTLTSENFPSNAIPNQCFIRIKAIKDSDHDGLSDEKERRWGTDPDNPDSDGDGFTDGYEIENGLNPTTLPQSTISLEPVQGIFYELIGTLNRTEIEYSLGLEDCDEAITLSQNSAADSASNSSRSSIVLDVDMPRTIAEPFAYKLSGLKFKPTRSGYFRFAIAADDYAYLKVGTAKACANWHMEDGGSDLKYFIAGIEYDVEIFHRNDGGPTFLTCIDFASFFVESPYLRNSLTEDVVLFESVYQNSMNGPAITNSTTTACFIEVFGGRSGGVLTIETENIDKLDPIEGLAIADTSYTIGICERFALQCAYHGKAASDTLNDVKIKTVFRENYSDSVISNEVELTVVNAHVSTSFSPSGTNQRHIFGPLEEVSIIAEPQSIPISWVGETATLGAELHDGSKEYTFNEFTSFDHYTTIIMPSHAYKGYVSFAALGKRLDIPLRTINPTGIRATRYSTRPTLRQWREAANNPNFIPTELYCGLTIASKIVPSYACFKNIRIGEGWCPATNNAGSLSFVGPHDRRAGAYKIHGIDQLNNVTGVDLAARYGVQPIEGDWTGYSEWNIPLRWRPSNESTNNWDSATCLTNCIQVSDCSFDGTLTIKKLGCESSRKVGD